MLTPSRLEEVAAWMKANGIATVSGVNADYVHMSPVDLKRLAPGAEPEVTTEPYRVERWSTVIDGQNVIAMHLDIAAYTAHQNR